MNSSHHPQRHAAIETQASNWIARRNAGLDAAAQAELDVWLAADPRHAAAFGEFDRAWRLLNAPRQAGATATMVRELARARHRRARKRRQVAFSSIAVMAAALAVAFWTSSVPALAPPAIPATATLRPDRQVLPDGSEVELNAATEIEVAFTGGRRTVLLHRGEALFTVKRSEIPFVVLAGGVEVRAVGTAFAVRYAAQEVGVLVTHGRVAVQRAADPVVAAREPTFLNAGAAVVVPVDAPAGTTLAVVTPSSERVAAALAWRGHRVEFTDTPLTEAMELFNRQNRVQLAIPDAALRARRITGIFWSDDPVAFVRLLESGLDLRSERVGDTLVLRSR